VLPTRGKVDQVAGVAHGGRCLERRGTGNFACVSDWAPIRYVRNGGVSIAYSTLGTGPVDLLFVGGFVSHLEIGAESERARHFWQRLASFSRVIAFDKRGLGLSDREAAPYTLEDVIDDALAVLDAVNARRVVVFGVSEGGSAAALLAATHPGRVQALVQFGTFPRLVSGPDYPDGLTLEALRGLERFLADSWGDPRSIDLWAPSLARDPQEREWWGRMLRSGLSRGSLHRIELMYEGVDVRPVLDSVKVPTLVLYRAHDRLIPAALSRAMAEGIPGARAVELPGEDHLYLGDDQDAMLDLVEEFVTGRPVTPVTERVLATVVFCDVVGSTELAARLGDRQWQSLLADHHRITEREVARYRGRLVQIVGDGSLSTFDGPARAIRSAQAILDASAPLGLQLRAGVHTGEIEVSGPDIVGLAVHLAARVEAAAQPGEVLVSSTVKDLVVGSGLQFNSRGEHALKGVPGVWHLYSVCPDPQPRPLAAPDPRQQSVERG
jgi:class 3 adenylate cyclase